MRTQPAVICPVLPDVVSNTIADMLSLQPQVSKMRTFASEMRSPVHSAHFLGNAGIPKSFLPPTPKYNY